ncbi:hypothetical protein B0I35DRAFT_427475 [Stachybotrys elegans]|uniref:Zn(2)-C6 fungal-type domain-containing protein n=1 Tax=Stachybotrys elegans TaxID=80388 RepID=A0A8K0WSA0_9HYPO|nr:hypothetical protein B0I35DRAFT_427475 [Stachybotrys elegans]
MEQTGPRQKQAACLSCRRSKIRCEYDVDQERCRRCLRLDVECVRLLYQPGRQKGIKNKRRGLDKALFQIDQAVKRARSGSNKSLEDEQILAQLRQILSDDRGSASTSISPRSQMNSGSYGMPDSSDSSDDDDGRFTSTGAHTPHDHMPRPSLVHRNSDSLAVDDAENPLQLLARASYLQPSPGSRYGKSPQSMRAPSNSDRAKGSIEDLQAFFAPARVNLDIGDDMDPVALGLVSEEEADSLFAFFYQNLAHTRWGLEPRLYTADFTRSRSAFLATSIMAASALFMPSCAALSKRLSNHQKDLAHRVINGRYKSVEIVLAFLVNIPWMFPGKQSTDDESCTYISMATTIATDLSLEKSVVFGEMMEPNARVGFHRGDYLEPRAALAIDGFPDLDPWSDIGRLLLRNRERCWISLFVLERGMSLARGRPFSVPVTRLLKECDNWHRFELADPQDGPLVSMAVLRRDLDGMFSTVRALCDGSRNPSTDGALVAQAIQGSIERFFMQWFTEWGSSIGRGLEGRLPPYVEILVTHTRLSIYGGVINHPTAPLEVRRFFHTAGLSAALSVMRVAIQGESQLQSMPNNTAIMISFAACFALALSAHTTGESILAPSVRNLIEEAATVLIRIGRITKHRNGLSVLYGKYLKQIVKRAVSNGEALRNTAMDTGFGPSPVQHEQHPIMTPNPVIAEDQELWPETFQFSAMSDAQIQQVLNQPGNDLEAGFGGLSWEDMTNFEWLYWPDIGI